MYICWLLSLIFLFLTNLDLVEGIFAYRNDNTYRKTLFVRGKSPL